MIENTLTMVKLAEGLDLPEHYGDWQAEYRAARSGIALVDRSHRGWVELRGMDRAAWLHNLVTNEVKNLSPGVGAYAFATNTKGRTVFDLHYLVDPEAIWLDIDVRWLPAALAHLNHFVIMEDVSLTDRTDKYTRLGLCGPKLDSLWKRIGGPHKQLPTPASHTVIEIDGAEVRAFRTDFAGEYGVELAVPKPAAEAVRQYLVSQGAEFGIAPVGWKAIQAVRIEGGVPWSLEDIDEQVVPPETGRVEQGISYQKGCYLGQEVIERMRSRNVQVRTLTGLSVEGDVAPTPGAEIRRESRNVGRITSVCFSPSLNGYLALGYVPIACAKVGTAVHVVGADGSFEAVVIELPLCD